MAYVSQDRCAVCGEEKLVRAWTTHHKSGNKVYPVRKMALAFCVNPECPESGRGRKAA